MPRRSRSRTPRARRSSRGTRDPPPGHPQPEAAAGAPPAWGPFGTLGPCPCGAPPGAAFGAPPPGAAPGGYGLPQFPPGMGMGPGAPSPPGMGHPYWGDKGIKAESGKDKARDKKKKKKKATRKKRRKRKRSSSDSSSSSSSSSSASSEASEWRKPQVPQGWPQVPQGWPAGAWPPGQAPPPGMMWPGAPGWPPMPHGMPIPPGGPLPPGADLPPSAVADHPSAPSRTAASSGWEGETTLATPQEDVPIFLEPAVEDIVPVPKALLGKVIGKQAQTIIEIREKSGAFKVDARDQTSDPCQVKIAGTADAVRKARALIEELVESTKLKHSGSDYVEIPRAKIGMVIGLKGSQVNDIQIQTGTKIDVDFESDPCKCYIKGPPEAVERSKQVLLTIAMQIEDGNSEYLDLPKAASGALIGAQGSRVREFQEASGARIDVDKTGAFCRVRLTGSKEQVANAKQLVIAEVERSTAAPRNLSILNESASVQPVVVPAHQPTSFPATLSESIARAKAAAEAIKSGLVTHVPALPPPPPPMFPAQPPPPPMQPPPLGQQPPPFVPPPPPPLSTMGALGSNGLLAFT